MEIIGIYFSGILSFLSPCILPVIPVYFATILGNIEQKSRYRVFTAGLFFCIGFTVIFTILGMGAAATGDLIQGNRAIINLVAGIILIILGLHFLRIIIIPVMESSYNIDAAKFRTPFPVLNALIMGIIFGLTWSPCIGPVLGGILTYIASQETGVAGGGIRLMVFGAGISTPLLLFALFTDKITKFIKNNRPFITMLNRLLGLVLVVFAVYLLKDVPAKPQTGNPSPDNANTASHQILKPGKLPLLVAVHSTECSICTEMLPVIRKLQKSCNEKVIDIRLIYADDSIYANLVWELAIPGTPTYLFINKNGDEIKRMLGYQDLVTLDSEIARQTGKHCIDTSAP